MLQRRNLSQQDTTTRAQVDIQVTYYTEEAALPDVPLLEGVLADFERSVERMRAALKEKLEAAKLAWRLSPDFFD